MLDQSLNKVARADFPLQDEWGANNEMFESKEHEPNKACLVRMVRLILHWAGGADSEPRPQDRSQDGESARDTRPPSLHRSRVATGGAQRLRRAAASLSISSPSSAWARRRGPNTVSNDRHWYEVRRRQSSQPPLVAHELMLARNSGRDP